jgi:hypothetical protein
MDSPSTSTRPTQHPLFNNILASCAGAMMIEVERRNGNYELAALYTVGFAEAIVEALEARNRDYDKDLVGK